MYVLITYDVSTINSIGKRRLRHVAKICEDFGQRVQNSVFECKVDPAQFADLKNQLLKTIDLTSDSIRFYLLGTNWERRVEHHGAKEGYNIEGPLIV